MSLHEAYEILSSTKINAQIESITGYDNKVLIGTQKGQLLLYSVDFDKTENKLNFQFVEFNANFSKKAVTQIEVVPDYKILFSLSDGTISVNDLSRSTFPLIFTAPKTKGASIFTLDVMRVKSQTGETALVVRICVAVKRKLQFYFWKNATLETLAPDIDLNDIPRTLAWIDDTVCVGFKTEYVLYRVSGEKSELFPTSSSRNVDPCMAIIGSLFGVAKDEYLISVDPKDSSLANNKAATQRPSDFLSMRQDAASGGGGGLKKFKSLQFSQPPQVVVHDEPYIVALLNDEIEVRVLESTGAPTLIQSVANLPKARFLIRVKQGMFFAASISNLWGIQAVNIPKQRQNLLKHKRFQLAVQLTDISDESKADKDEKVEQIQTLYAYDLFENKRFQESMDEFAKLNRDPTDIIRLFPDLLVHDNSKSTSNYIEKPGIVLEGHDLENGLLALISYLTLTRYNLNVNMNDNQLSSSETQRINTLLSIIDTTLLKCYLQTNDSLVAPLLRLNNCVLDESERTLVKYQKFGELIILYQTKGQHKKALQVLQSQAVVVDSSLFGHERTIQYLQHLGSDHKHLIFEFSGWVLEKYPEDGLKIFTEDMQEVENLPRAEVLDFLLKNNKNLAVPYLEHVIHVWDETKPMFHNILIQEYREKITSLKQELSNHATPGSEKQKQILMDNTRKKLLDFLKKTTKYDFESVLTYFPTNDLFEERAIILGRQKKHEKALAIYIQILGDIDKANEYCASVYENKDNAKDNDIYLILIKLLLKPPQTAPYGDATLHPRCLNPDIETVLDILEEHGTKINPYSVLLILPDDIPVVRLKTFLEVALHNQLERKRKTQVLKGLYSAENLQVQEQRRYYESQSVLITDFSVCLVCGKKFGYQGAFVRYPNGNIVHFSCQNRNQN